MKSISEIIGEKFYNKHKNNEKLLSPEEIINKSNGFFNVWSGSPHFQLVGLRNSYPYFGFKSGIYVKYSSITFLTGRGDDDYFEIDLEFHSYEIEKLIYSENKISFENWRGLKSIKCDNEEIKLVKEFIDFYKSEKKSNEDKEKLEKERMTSKEIIGYYDKFTNETSYSFTFLNESNTYGSIYLFFRITTSLREIKKITLKISSRSTYQGGEGRVKLRFQENPRVLLICNGKDLITISEVLSYSSDGDPMKNYSISEELEFHIGEEIIKKIIESKEVEYSMRGNKTIQSEGKILTHDLLHFFNSVIENIN